MSNISTKESTDKPKTQLEQKTLFVRQNSITIGPVHKQVLQDRRKQLERQLTQSKLCFEQRIIEEEHSSTTTLNSNNSGTFAEDCHPNVHDDTPGQSSGAEAASPTVPIKVDELSDTCQEELNSLHKSFQKQLDDLYTRYQKEWIKDPRQTGKLQTL